MRGLARERYGSKRNMELRLRLLLLLALICLHAPRRASAQQPEEATVIVKGSSRIAATDDNYVCATIDWWPPEKCNYNQCPWGQASILNLDLDHPFLAEAIQAFDHLRIRLGGSLQDRVVYDVGTESPCSPFTNVSSGLFGFSVGCLGMDRWDKLNDLFQRTGAIVTFGVNALYGRYNVRRSIWAGKWNSTNAYDFIKYTISKGYPVSSWEFGNELSGHGIGAKVDAILYGKDVIEFKSILRQLYKAPLSQPLLLAPGGFFDQQWYSQLLETSGHGVVNALSHHVYSLGGVTAFEEAEVTEQVSGEERSSVGSGPDVGVSESESVVVSEQVTAFEEAEVTEQVSGEERSSVGSRPDVGVSESESVVVSEQGAVHEQVCFEPCCMTVVVEESDEE